MKKKVLILGIGSAQLDAILRCKEHDHEFILYDHVQYTERDWRNRNKIKTHQGMMWLTIPVRNNFPQKIKETVVSYPGWNRKHWKSIVRNYSRTKYFHNYRELFEELYLGQNEVSLGQINHRFLTAICKILGINTKISWSMDYHLIEGDKTEREVDLCKQAGATEFICGPRAKAYINEDLFKNEGMVLRYMDYSEYPEYRQLFPPFEHRVSIIDLIFNEGPDSTKFMKGF